MVPPAESFIPPPETNGWIKPWVLTIRIDGTVKYPFTWLHVQWLYAMLVINEYYIPLYLVLFIIALGTSFPHASARLYGTTATDNLAGYSTDSESKERILFTLVSTFLETVFIKKDETDDIQQIVNNIELPIYEFTQCSNNLFCLLQIISLKNYRITVWFNGMLINKIAVYIHFVPQNGNIIFPWLHVGLKVFWKQ